jgi:ZIP family zinc transporter
VWYYGWITAVSTGLGVIPFFFIPEPDRFWMGVSNAVASGMMITASCSLFYEGATFNEIDGE